MSEQQNERPRTPFDEFKLRVAGKPLREGLRPPTLGFNVYQNNPNFRVYTNVPDEKPLYAGLDLYNFMIVLDTIEMFATNPEMRGHEDILCRTGSPKELKLAAKIRVGVDEQNSLFMAILIENRDPIKFIFGPSRWHQLIDQNGDPVSRDVVSRRFGRIFAKTAGPLVITYLANNPSQEKPNFGNNKGNGQRQGGWKNNNGGKKWNNGGKKWNNGGGNGGGGWKNNQGGNGGGWQDRNQGSGGDGGQSSGDGGWSDDYPM